MSGKEITLDDQIEAARQLYIRFHTRCRAGRGWRIAAFICTATVVFGAVVGIPLQYHQMFLSKQDEYAIMVLLGSWCTGVLGIICSIAGIVASRGMRGWIALFLAIGVLATSIFLANAFPSYGLGNIH